MYFADEKTQARDRVAGGLVSLGLQNGRGQDPDFPLPREKSYVARMSFFCMFHMYTSPQHADADIVLECMDADQTSSITWMERKSGNPSIFQRLLHSPTLRLILSSETPLAALMSMFLVLQDVRQQRKG